MYRVSHKNFVEAQVLCTKYNAQIFFGYSGEGSEVDVEERYIHIDLKEVKSESTFWSLVFHELAHIWCYDNDKYYTYHHMDLPDKKLAIYMRKYGLKAERYVDKIGKKLMREYGFTMRYYAAYSSKDNVKWYKKWLDREFPL